MPYTTEREKLDSKFLKRSAKLIDCQRAMVHWWHQKGMSIHSISKLFKVSRRSSYLLHIGAGNLHSVEMFAYLNGVTLTPNQLRKYVLAAIRKASKKKLVKQLNEHVL